MTNRYCNPSSAPALLLAVLLLSPYQKSTACCAVARSGATAVNADQTVIMIWDKKTKTQHFIRQASFKSDARDVGFLVPSPSQPQLEESGDDAFTELAQITAPVSRGGGSWFPLGCSADANVASYGSVQVLERKLVAGFDAAVLKAGSSSALVDWLAANGYAYSPQVAGWAEPYIAKGWPLTALKVAPSKKDSNSGSSKEIKASALRISFRTEQPLFPYREPDSGDASRKLGASGRLLRIYFIAEAAYEGTFETGEKWTGRKVWSGDITNSKSSLLDKLKLPAGSGPRRWWLTEIEDRWPYAVAPGDVYFSRSRNQSRLKRYAGAETGTDPFIMGAILLGLGMVFKRRLTGSHRADMD